MKRCLSFLLSMLMLLSMLPISSIVANAETTDEIEFTEVRTVEDLYMINFDLAGNFKLMNDIDLSADTAEGGDWDYLGNGWEPIGSNNTYSGGAFTGTFDGNGYTISGLRIAVNNAPTSMENKPYVGLFANNAGTIKNLTVSGNISNTQRYGLFYTGGIAGYNSGTISGCTNKVEISVKKTSYVNNSFAYDIFVGGIAGYNKGSITQSYNVKNIIGDITYNDSDCDAYIAGIATGSGTISDCYNTGDITAKNLYSNSYAYSAGINCYGSENKVSNCYNIGTAKKAISYSSVNNCYFLSGTGEDVTGAKSLTNAQMKIQAMYNGFDFENVWFIDRASEYVYPQLINNPQIPLPKVEVTKVEFKSVPAKLNYETGDNIDLTGGQLAVYYSDNTVEYVDINENMVSVKKFTYAGEQDVKVYYGNFELSYKVNVIKVTKITKLEIAKMPDKTNFVQNTAFDFTGATALATYDDGTTKTVEITTENTTGGDITKTGKYTITFEYEGLTTQFEVNVIEKPRGLTGVAVITPPTKQTYYEGKNFDASGLVVYTVYDNGDIENVENYILSGYDSTIGEKTIIVTYEGFTTSFKVNVIEKPVELIAIHITNLPDKLEYEYGEVLDTTGLVVVAVYSDGSLEPVTDYEISLFSNTDSVQTIGVTYKGFTKTFDVKITEKPKRLFGDVDGDGKVSVIDATSIQKYLVQSKPFTKEELECADTDRDGKITVMDATRIQKYLVNFITEL